MNRPVDRLLRLGAFLLVSSLAFGQTLGQGELRCNDVRNQSLGRGEQHLYTFEAEAGEVLYVTLHKTGGETFFGPRAWLYGPPAVEGPPLLASVFGQIRVEIHESGTHTLRVSDDNMFEVGSYVLGIHWLCPAAKQCAVTPLVCREGVNRGLNRRADSHSYSLDAAAGEHFTFTLHKTGGETFFGPRLDLYGPDACAEPLFRDHFGIRDLVLPETGRYTLRVRDDNQYEVGSYVLTVQRLEPFCDCNGNGSPDDADISSGVSRDDDGNLVPDECQNGAWFRLEDAGSGCVRLLVQARVPLRGGEIALSYDGATAAVARVEKGAALGAPARVEWRGDLSTAGCPADPETSRGLVAGWVSSESTNVLLPIGTHHVLTLCFDAPAGARHPLKFASGCLGGPQPGENIVTNQAGSTLAALTEDVNVTVPAGLFRRGDANDDGRFDISDAVTVLICKFLGIACHPCLDAFDANDDGAADITDAIYLLNWRFQNGPPPAPPFPACGLDPTEDALADCTQRRCS
jgi:hypothetical protein